MEQHVYNHGNRKSIVAVASTAAVFMMTATKTIATTSMVTVIVRLAITM